MLERIQKANDIKKLAPEELPELAQEIRWPSCIKSWRGRAYDGNTSGF